ncbi:MAG: aldehyde ferredoxin oxidoreductase, partial [Magnetospirillum sp.]
MSWTGKFLRIDLTSGRVKVEDLNRDWARQYLGQRGLATKYFAAEVDPKVDPLSPANKLIFTTGPLTGTAASTGGRYSVVTKGPLTGCIACSNSGGFFGNELKNAGWDMIIIEGKSPKPVYLSIDNETAELRDASGYWGKTVWETENGLKAQHQDPMLRVASIGAAGEKGVLYSCIVNDLHRAAGRSGVGAVMGSKNLKAVAVRGTRGVRVKDPDRFIAATIEQKKVLADNAVTSQGLPKYGTQVLMNVINELGAMPTRNFQDVQFEGAHKISAEAMYEPRPTDGKTNLVTNGACFGCTIACGRISRMDPGHFSIASRPRYRDASGGVEYEAAWAMGSDCGVDDLEACTFANFMCNEHGIDPISFGSTLAAAMELYEMGVLTTAHTGGVELKFGSAGALTKMAELTGKGEGFGLELGLGSRRFCEKYGHPELSM